MNSMNDFRVVFMPIVEKSMKGDRLTMSGFVSTEAIDLAGDSCPWDSWVKHLANFQANPIYCYNHDKEVPIGKVSKTSAVPNQGLHFEDIQLTPIPFVKDILSLLILDGVVQQQSAGFFNIKRMAHTENPNVTILQENFLVEGSLVSVAMNPHGTSIQVNDKLLNSEGMYEYKSITELMQHYDSGLINKSMKFVVPSEYAKIPMVAKGGTIIDTSKMNNLAPIFARLQATTHVEKAYDPKGEIAKNAKASELTHAAVIPGENGAKDKFLFKLGFETAKGFNYDWEDVVTATAKIFGAKGGATFDSDVKANIVKRLESAYLALDKTFPTYEKSGDSMAEMPAWKLDDVHYSEVKFHEGEDVLVKNLIAKENIVALAGYLKAQDKETKEFVKSIPEAIEVTKYLTTDISVRIDAYNDLDDDDKGEFAFMQQLISLLAAKAAATADTDDSGMLMQLGLKKEDGEVKIERVQGATHNEDKENILSSDNDTEVAATETNYADLADAAVKAVADDGINHDNDDTDGKPNRKKGMFWNEKKQRTKKELDKIPADQYAGPHQSFPIEDQDDVDNAWDLRGHADDPAAVGKKIIEIATRLGLKAPKGIAATDKVKKSLFVKWLDEDITRYGRLIGRKEDEVAVVEYVKNDEGIFETNSTPYLLQKTEVLRITDLNYTNAIIKTAEMVIQLSNDQTLAEIEVPKPKTDFKKLLSKRIL
jgi:hypothetical protein